MSLVQREEGGQLGQAPQWRFVEARRSGQGRRPHVHRADRGQGHRRHEDGRRRGPDQADPVQDGDGQRAKGRGRGEAEERGRADRLDHRRKGKGRRRVERGSAGFGGRRGRPGELAQGRHHGDQKLRQAADAGDERLSHGRLFAPDERKAGRNVGRRQEDALEPKALADAQALPEGRHLGEDDESSAKVLEGPVDDHREDGHHLQSRQRLADVGPGHLKVLRRGEERRASAQQSARHGEEPSQDGKGARRAERGAGRSGKGARRVQRAVH
mmetsp:Transcript_25191/g.84665  ORF Transcript_25191/g.84665 Transcript_25191/m.84665 type:complete len:270 (+) Transcript_25191:9438-10247(+)